MLKLNYLSHGYQYYVGHYSAVFVAIMVVPALASYFFSRGIKPRENKLLKPLDNGYRLLSVALRSKKAVITLAGVLFVGALVLVPLSHRVCA